MIQDEYSKRYVKNSSIDSIFRCLYSFSPLTTQFLNIPAEQINNKPMTKAYIQCLQSVSNPYLLDWIKSIKYFIQVQKIKDQKGQKKQNQDLYLNFSKGIE